MCLQPNLAAATIHAGVAISADIDGKVLLRLICPTPLPLDHDSGGGYPWTGRALDVEQELELNRIYYYDPTPGRWLDDV